MYGTVSGIAVSRKAPGRRLVFVTDGMRRFVRPAGGLLVVIAERSAARHVKAPAECWLGLIAEADFFVAVWKT